MSRGALWNAVFGVFVACGVAAGCTDDGPAATDTSGADVADTAVGLDGGDDAAAEVDVAGDVAGDASFDDVADVAVDTGPEQVCAPGTWSCANPMERQQCNDAGTGWNAAEACGEERQCRLGNCAVRCPNNPKFGIYVGCEFWATDLPNYPDPTLNPTPENLPWALVVSNPGETAVTVAFELPPLLSYAPDDDVVEPGTSSVFQLPNINVQGTSVGQHGVHLVTSGPVLVHQFNPWDARYSNDATLLLPDVMLGMDHVILSWATSPLEFVQIIPGVPAPPNQNGYFTVIAAHDQTKVTFQTSAPVRASAPIPTLGANQLHTVTLNRGQVLSVQSDPGRLTENADISGTRVSADKPIAVFGGHEQATVGDPPPADPLNPEVRPTLCCADHLESQMLPVSLLGQRYFAVKSPPRGKTVIEPDFWRIQAAIAGVTLTTDPPLAGASGATLAQKGQFVQVKTPESFEIRATGPVQVGQYLVSQGATEGVIGDASLLVLAPVERFRRDYAFMLPDGGYQELWAVIVKPKAATVSIDGVVVTARFQPIGATDHEFAWVQLTAGVHEASSTERFGLNLYGYSRAVSFAFIGGIAGPRE